MVLYGPNFSLIRLFSYAGIYCADKPENLYFDWYVNNSVTRDM